MNIVYCPTERMLGDHLTKPLNRARFRFLRGIRMGHMEINEIFQCTLEEHVENTIDKNEMKLSAS